MPSAAPRRLWRRSMWRAAKLLLGLALLALIVHYVDVGRTWQVLRGVDPLPCLVAFVLGSVAFFIGTERWRMLLEEQDIAVRFWDVCGILLVSTFFNVFLPGGTLGADVIRTREIQRRSGKWIGSASSVVVDRVVGLTTLLALGFASALAAPFVPPADDPVEQGPFTLITGALLLLCMGALAGLLSPRLMAGAIPRALSLIGFGRLREPLEKASRALRRYVTRRGLLAKLFGLSLLFHVTRIVYFFALALALGIEVPFLAMMVIVPIVGIVHQLPVTVSGLGVREGAFVYFFGLLGVAAPASLAFSLLERIVALLHALVGGVVFLLRK